MVKRFRKFEIALADRVVLLVERDAWGVDGSHTLVEQAVEVEAYGRHEFLGYCDDHYVQSAKLVHVNFRYPADRPWDTYYKGVLPHPYGLEVDFDCEISVYAEQCQITVETAGFLHERLHPLFVALLRNEESV